MTLPGRAGGAIREGVGQGSSYASPTRLYVSEYISMSVCVCGYVCLQSLFTSTISFLLNKIKYERTKNHKHKIFCSQKSQTPFVKPEQDL